MFIVNNGSSVNFILSLFSSIIALIAVISAVINNGLVIKNNNKNVNKNNYNTIVSKNRVDWMQKLKELISEYSSIIAYYNFKQYPDNASELFERLDNITTQISLHLNFKGFADKEILNLIERTNTSYEAVFLYKEDLKNGNKNFSNFTPYCVKNNFYKYKNCFGEIANSLPEGFMKHFDEDDIPFILLEMNKEWEEKISVSQTINKCTSNIYDSYIRTIKNAQELLVILVQVYLKVEWERVKYEAENNLGEKFDFDGNYREYKNFYSDKINKICKECEFDFIDMEINNQIEGAE